MRKLAETQYHFQRKLAGIARLQHYNPLTEWAFRRAPLRFPAGGRRFESCRVCGPARVASGPRQSSGLPPLALLVASVTKSFGASGRRVPYLDGPRGVGARPIPAHNGAAVTVRVFDTSE